MHRIGLRHAVHALATEAQQVAHAGQHERAFRVVRHGEHRGVVDGTVLEGAAVLGHEQAAAWPAEAEEQFTVVFDDVPRALVEPVHVEFLAEASCSQKADSRKSKCSMS